MKTLIIGMLLIGSAHATTVKIEATTDTGFGAWFIPTNFDSVTTTFIEKGVNCINKVKGRSFELICQKNGKKFLIYQDHTPQKDATIATPEIVIKITTMRESK